MERAEWAIADGFQSTTFPNKAGELDKLLQLKLNGEIGPSYQSKRRYSIVFFPFTKFTFYGLQIIHSW